LVYRRSVLNTGVLWIRRGRRGFVTAADGNAAPLARPLAGRLSRPPCPVDKTDRAASGKNGHCLIERRARRMAHTLAIEPTT